MEQQSNAAKRSQPSPNLSNRERGRKVAFAGLLTLTSLIALTGCGAKPSTANIQLRQQVQDLQTQVAQLQTQHTGDAATIAAMKGATTQAGSTLPALAGDTADAAYTTHGIHLGKATGPADWDASHPGDDGLKVYVTPFDDDGDDFKAAGAITVEAFDLAAEKPAIGKWSFTAAEAKKLWNGRVLQYEYIVPCPWQMPPTHAELTLKVTFTDTLTGRSFSEQKIVKIKPAA